MKHLSLLFLIFLLSACANYGQLTVITKLPNRLKESSGMAYYQDDKVWTIEDHGNKDVIYQVDFKGNIRSEFKVKNAKNEDWEDLTTDKKGNLYVADIGNNDNDRKDLVIYKLPNPETELGDKINAIKIEFSYPEQAKFPPKKAELVFDAEAIFHRENHLFIITKNRATPFNGKTLIYKIPDTEGNHAAQLIGQFVPCKNEAICQITSAAVSPSGKKVVLLSYGFLWIYSDFSGDKFFEGTLKKIDLGARTQLEAVCFKDENTLLLSDEERAQTGQNLYSFQLE
tara:strand:+ start:18414 stop:19265 length:852 start_codon:yes stop_codon:yes gene_type:complete